MFSSFKSSSFKVTPYHIPNIVAILSLLKHTKEMENKERETTDLLALILS